MNIIVCLDDNRGLLFNRRRQSRDRVVIEDILEHRRGGRLFCAPFSAALFDGRAEVIIDEDFLSLAEEGDFCFVEHLPVSPQLARIETVTVYRWNRVYPADSYFDLSLTAPDWTLEESRDFPGHSHERLTREVYRR